MTRVPKARSHHLGLYFERTTTDVVGNQISRTINSGHPVAVILTRFPVRIRYPRSVTPLGLRKTLS